MRTKMFALIIVALFVVGMFLALPVFAGPVKSKGDKVRQYTHMGRYFLIRVTNRGWRQWELDAPDGKPIQFWNILFAESMNDDAVTAHINDGWTLYTYGAGAPQQPDIAHGDVDGDGAVDALYKGHTIP